MQLNKEDEHHMNVLIILLEAVYQQNSMLKFSFKQFMKKSFNNYDSNIERMLKEFKSHLDQEGMDYFEHQSIMFLEAVNEIQKCQSPKTMIALMQAFNEGLEIKVENTTLKLYHEQTTNKNQPIDNKADIEPQCLSA